MIRANTTSHTLTFDIAPGESFPQAETFVVSDLSFDNITNTPASFIKVGATSNGTVNGLIERCYFTDCAATYCIDNAIGYGTKVRNCVFSDITGSAIRLQQNSGLTLYSYVFLVDGCDITRPSVDGIFIQGAQGLRVTNTTIEGCGGKGIVAKCLTNSVQAWNVHLDGVHFELNTGNDVDFSDVNASFLGHLKLTTCLFVSSPTIALGGNSRAMIDTCAVSGGDVVTVSGSSQASAVLINSFNFTKSGTFRWIELDPTTSTSEPLTFNPQWGADSVNPAIGNGTLVAYYTRIGKQVHVDIDLTMGSTTTFGTGDWFFSVLPFDCNANIGACGAAELFDNSTGNNYPATARITKNTAVVRIVAPATTLGGVDSAQPFTWAQSDILRFSLDYVCA
jgi:hypothetical protein